MQNKNSKKGKGISHTPGFIIEQQISHLGYQCTCVSAISHWVISELGISFDSKFLQGYPRTPSPRKMLGKKIQSKEQRLSTPSTRTARYRQRRRPFKPSDRILQGTHPCRCKPPPQKTRKHRDFFKGCHMSLLKKQN